MGATRQAGGREQALGSSTHSDRGEKGRLRPTAGWTGQSRGPWASLYQGAGPFERPEDHAQVPGQGGPSVQALMMLLRDTAVGAQMSLLVCQTILFRHCCREHRGLSKCLLL